MIGVLLLLVLIGVLLGFVVFLFLLPGVNRMAKQEMEAQRALIEMGKRARWAPPPPGSRRG